MSIPFGISDTREWMALLIGDLFARLPAPAAMDAQDPVLDLEREWMAIEEEVNRLHFEFDAIGAALLERHGDPRAWGNRTRWKRDPDQKKQAQLSRKMDRLTEQQCDVRDAMVETDATTPAGIHAKLRVAARKAEDRSWKPPSLPPITLDFVNETIKALAEVVV